MSLLDSLPDRCTIYRRVREKDSLAGSRDSLVVERSDVSCWEQQASASDVVEYERKAMSLRSKIYFAQDPQVSRRHLIVVTSRGGRAVAEKDRVAMDVLDSPQPDVSAGRGLLWRVMVGTTE